MRFVKTIKEKNTHNDRKAKEINCVIKLMWLFFNVTLFFRSISKEGHNPNWQRLISV